MTSSPRSTKKIFIVPTSSTKHRRSASSQRTWSNPCALAFFAREETRRVISCVFASPAPRRRARTAPLPRTADEVSTPARSTPHRAGDDEEPPPTSERPPRLGCDHRGTNVRETLVPRDPLPVEPHQRAGRRLLTIFDQDLRQAHAPPNGSAVPRSGPDGRDGRAVPRVYAFSPSKISCP